MSRLKKIVWVLAVGTILLGKAQEFPQIIPPGPNAASLGQYADVPVSNYTGVPNIMVPLFEIKSGEIKLPITISYHASGIKVAQEASLVGLGWALNAGGVITRQVRGLDDFDVNGYLTTGELPPATDDNLPDWSDTANFNNYLDYYNSIRLGHKDGEPDIFYYNFLGYSGKIVFKKQSGIELKATSLDQNNLDITYNKASKMWTIIDGSGWKYSLGSTELNAVETTTYYTMSSYTPFLNPPLVLGEDIRDVSSITAWHLTKVITPKGESIEFIYENLGSSLSQLSFGELRYKLLDLRMEWLQGSPADGYISPGHNPTELFSLSQQRIAESYLKRIHFRNGMIEFNHEDREDLRPHFSGFNPKRLQSAELFDLDGKPIKKIDFTYGYFNYDKKNTNVNPENYLRLRLDNIQESLYEGNNDIQEKPPYVFSYNNTILPEKTSYSVDYWGYYNGKNNKYIRVYPFFKQDFYRIGEESTTIRTYKTLVPFYGNNDGNRDVYLTGANREVDIDKIKAGVLKSIQYPTGAVTEFTYEPNDYYDEFNPLFNLEQRQISVQNYGYDTPTELKEKTFTLNHDTVIYLEFNLYQNNPLEASYESSFPESSFVLERENGEGVASLDLNMPYTGNPVYLYTGVLLTPGTYKLKAISGFEPGIDVLINANYTMHEPTTKKHGAGLRVETIIVKDNGGIVKQKKYSYENNGISTGRIMSPKQFYYFETLRQQRYIIQPGLVINILYEMDYLVRTSNSLMPMGTSTQGKIIGYDEVIVSNKDITNNIDLGSSKFYYKNEEIIPPNLFMPNVPNFIHPSNGQLLKEKYFNEDDGLVREKNISYLIDETTKTNLKGVKLYSYFASSSNSSLQIRFYDIYSEWWHPTSETETIFDVNGESAITTSTIYEYDNPNHKQLTKTTTTSNGKTITKKLFYPDDVTSTTALPGGALSDAEFQAIKQMQAPTESNPNGQHRIAEVVQEVTEVVDAADSVATSKRTVYANWGNNRILPKSVQTLKGTATSTGFEERVVYHRYDSSANPLEVSQKDGMHTVYLYGYTKQYPIAKIENASFAEVATALGVSEDTLENYNENHLDSINALRAQKPDWMITTYTHIPLVGVETITDPKGMIMTYEYDGFNRLKHIKDPNGDILEAYDYHYKTE